VVTNFGLTTYTYG